MKTYRELKEEMSMTTGIAGVKSGDEPPVRVCRKKFAGNEVFEVSDEVYSKCVQGKAKFHRYEKYVGDDEVGCAIREYGRTNPGKPIVLQNSRTGAMIYLKR